jgi:two-component system, NtrC family, response regulator AtoC
LLAKYIDPMSSNDDRGQSPTPSSGRATIPPSSEQSEPNSPGQTSADQASSAPSDLATELEATGLDEGDEALAGDQVYLILQQGEQRRIIDVADGKEMVVGRDEDCDITIDEGKVSRRHFSLRRKGPLVVVADLDSTNGTKLNGLTLRGAERRLVGGDVIGIGRSTLTVAATASSGVAGMSVTSRLDLELQRLAQEQGRARLLRIDLPPAAPLESVLSLLHRVAIVETRDEGQLVALVEGADDAAVNGLVGEVTKLAGGAEVTTAIFPDDGTDLAKLWRAAGRTQADDIPDDVPKGVCIADPAMLKVFRVARRVAKTDTTVLVLGETGVGKEVLAEQLHLFSARAAKPYVRLNCASLPETLLSSELFGHERGSFTGADRRKIGYFEAADGGTLLLDEIGELSLSMQVKLLRVLENRTVLRIGATQEIPVDVRVICATHRDLQTEVAEGRFREDLYYRVSAFSLLVPPLRERPTEVGLLAELFMRQHAERMGIEAPRLDDAVVAALTGHNWPGNVRELRNAIEHAFVMCDDDTITLEHLPETLRAAAGPTAEATTTTSGETSVKDKLEQIERASLVKALGDENGNQTRAAKRLGMSRRALIYKMGKYDIKRQR